MSAEAVLFDSGDDSRMGGFEAAASQDPEQQFYQKYQYELAAYAIEYKEKIGIDFAASPDTYDEMCKREWGFYSKVRAAVREAADNNYDEAVLLFDRDNTQWEGLLPNVVVRMAYKASIDDAQKEVGDKIRIRVGALTTLRDKRGKTPAVCVAGVDQDLIAPEYMIDTRTYLRVHPEVGKVMDLDEAQQLSYLQDIILPDVLDATRDQDVRMNDWQDPDGKHMILQDLVSFFKRTGANTRVIFIDNMVTAAVMNPEYVTGVHVGPEMQNYDDFRPRFARGLLGKVLEAAGVSQ